MAISLVVHADGLQRCSWCGQGEGFADYIAYHDQEWGMPLANEWRLFEKITLEGFQAGLSWLTILRRRERFRQVFKQFDFEKVARFTQKDVQRLMQDEGIIRHRGKIESCINNAQKVCDWVDAHGAGSLARLIWSFEPSKSQRPGRITPEVLASLGQTAQSQALSKTLRQMGFNFVGPTTMYALMQSVGLVNDHLHGCAQHAKVQAARLAFERP